MRVYYLCEYICTDFAFTGKRHGDKGIIISKILISTSLRVT